VSCRSPTDATSPIVAALNGSREQASKRRSKGESAKKEGNYPEPNFVRKFVESTANLCLFEAVKVRTRIAI